MYANNNRNKEDKKCKGQQTREEEDGLDTKDKVNPYPSTPGQSKTEEKSPLTPEEEKRWIELEANEKKADEEPANQKQRDRSASKDETIDSLPDNVKSIARNLRIAVEQMHLGLTKAKELILETARQLDEEHVEEQDKICKKIKEILKDKIQEGKISEGWIEECLPSEYKRKYARTESQQNHLSELVVSTKGNQISQSDIDSKAPDTEAISSLFKRQEVQSPSSGEGSPAEDVNSHPSDKYIGQECSSCLELQDQVTQLKEVLQQISISTADQIQAFGFEFIIPKEEHELVKDAMDKSKSAIIVIYDQSKKFVRALADVDN
jgi:hypothetical protein